jgi:hypothetical protein
MKISLYLSFIFSPLLLGSILSPRLEIKESSLSDEYPFHAINYISRTGVHLYVSLRGQSAGTLMVSNLFFSVPIKSGPTTLRLLAFWHLTGATTSSHVHFPFFWPLV